MAGDPKGLVLVVEDDQNIRELICESLTAAGLKVAEAADGEEAVARARAERPAAIVLDIGLPLLDGAAVADQIRDMHEEPIPVIVVSAGGRQDDISRIRPTAQITKPFDLAVLVATVKSALEPGPSPGGAQTQPAVET